MESKSEFEIFINKPYVKVNELILGSRDSGKTITNFNAMLDKKNTLVKSQYPLFFSFLGNEEPYHEERDHRRGSTFYVVETYFIDQDTLDEYKQEYEVTEDVSFLLGYWQTPARIWTDDWGFDEPFDCLSRVERKIKVIEEEYFEPITDGE